MTEDDLLARLRAAVGDRHVVTDADVLSTAATDWTGRFTATPRCLVRPGSTDEVAATVRACAAAGVPVTPQGGNTGLVGGAVPADGGVVLSTSRLQRLDEVDDTAGTVVAGAGVTLARLRAHAAGSGWGVGVDLASRDAATVGGMVATDAGGARVVLHGSTRAQVVGLEAVLADGSVATPWFDGAAKDTAGYQLAQLLVGSEGTLAVVTAARLRLVRPVDAAAVVVLGVAAAGAVPRVVAAVRRAVAASGATLAACELVTAEGLALVAGITGAPSPVTSPIALLLELAGPVDDAQLVTLAVAGDTDAPVAGDAEMVVGLDERDRRRLWALREQHTDAVARLGVPVKLDVAVPPARFGELLERAPRVAADAAPGARTILFGHAAEANLHVNVVLPSADVGTPPPPTDATAVEDAVLALVAELGGTVSAEHGVGREKVRHLGLTRDPGSLAAMRAIKDALDPDGVLNPGVVLPRRGAGGPAT